MVRSPRYTNFSLLPLGVRLPTALASTLLRCSSFVTSQHHIAPSQLPPLDFSVAVTVRVCRFCKIPIPTCKLSHVLSNCTGIVSLCSAELSDPYLQATGVCQFGFHSFSSVAHSPFFFLSLSTSLVIFLLAYQESLTFSLILMNFFNGDNCMHRRIPANYSLCV